MMILAWNCRGVAKPSFMTSFKRLVQVHCPEICYSPPCRKLDSRLGIPPAASQDLPMLGAGLDGVVRFGLTPLTPGVLEDTTPGRCVVGDHPTPRLEESTTVAGGGMDHSTALQQVRAAVMGVVSTTVDVEEQRGIIGVEPMDGPATLGEEGSEADYVDCDP